MVCHRCSIQSRSMRDGPDLAAHQETSREQLHILPTRESFDKHNLCLYYQLNSRTNGQTRRGGQKGEFPASLPRRCTCKACIRSVPVPWGLCLRRNLRRVSAQRLDTGKPYIIRTTLYCEQSSGDVLSKRYAWRRLFLRLTLDSHGIVHRAFLSLYRPASSNHIVAAATPLKGGPAGSFSCWPRMEATSYARLSTLAATDSLQQRDLHPQRGPLRERRKI
ncbi:hypothetical protein TESG_01364 [Trichophyton tonsurans CBS 112818]|uniref:Uncharacterized protein n=1 Tax=Trichophyton tonsurans (strain CBS 112818) TaxID=647933 RepID=F2RRC3_TRIT1|nr:hypothetical protein TESG_01364 [Trichophyton tonsurans CBS 112818]